MRYMKAGDVLPPDLIDKIQSYIDGEYLYIPRRASNRKSWGAANDRRAQTQERNREICGRYLSGVSVRQLSEQYFLAPKSIQKIISGLK